MTPLDHARAAAHALDPDSLREFRAWLTAYADAEAPPMRVDTLGKTDDCRPEHYADFNEDAYDRHSEALDAHSHERAMRDLRKLESIEDELDGEARAAREKVSSDFFDKLFLENDPKPPIKADPVERAEWEWRRLEEFFSRGGGGPALTQHRLQHGAFVERHAAWNREFDARVARAAASSYTPPPPADDEPDKTWPPADGSDPIGPWLMFEYMDPEELDDELRKREYPDYKLVDDLQAACMGWWQSVPTEARDLLTLFDREFGPFRSAVSIHRIDGVRPFSIAGDILKLRRGLEHVPRALEILDALQGFDWMTAPAYACLRVLLEEAGEAAQARLAEVEHIYAGLHALAHERYGTHNHGFGRGYSTADGDDD